MYKRQIQGLQVTPLPVLHGKDLVSHGFAFSFAAESGALTHVVYLSDLSEVVPETLCYIREQLPPTDILIVDALHMADSTHPTHYVLQQSLATHELLQPRKTYLVGMSCDSFPPHEEMNRVLYKRYQGAVELAHDGLIVDPVVEE